MVVGRGNGHLTAVRLVVGERFGVRLSVTGSGDRRQPDAFLDAVAGFFDTVRLGPEFGPPVLESATVVSAADLGAAYRTDPQAADATYKGRWVRVTGPVAALGPDGWAFELAAGGTPIAVQRAPRGRSSVRVRAGGESVTVTGKCMGATEPVAGAGPRIVLANATVARPAKTEKPK